MPMRQGSAERQPARPAMLDILIRCEILKAVEWLGGSPELLTGLRGAPKRRLYDALESLSADRELLGAVGSWLDTWTDDEVLSAVREWPPTRSTRCGKGTARSNPRRRAGRDVKEVTEPAQAQAAVSNSIASMI